MKRITLLFLFLFASGILFSQIPPGYYNGTAGLTGITLKNKLHDIISAGYSGVSYTGLWTSYSSTDARVDGKVWDMYSDIPGGTAPYTFTFGTNQCGTYNSEADCYNREHCVPQSWFSGASPMYSDLYNVLPTDGYVNNKRSNFCYGDVATASWISMNGSKLGSSAVPGYALTVFEPIDSFKGDFARIYFYMATRYKDEIPTWTADPFSGSDLSTWAKELFLEWNSIDPVSAKEMARNNSVYAIQNNRNPYVDHPEWIHDIWGYATSVKKLVNDNFKVNFYPNPAQNELNVDLGNAVGTSKVSLLQIEGKTIISKIVNESKFNFDISNIPNGIYFITVQNDLGFFQKKVAIVK